MTSQSAGNQPPTNLPSTTDNLSESNQVSISDNVKSLKNDTLSILKSTRWPRRSTNAARDLLRIIENASSLENIPKEETQIRAEHRDFLEQFIRIMRSVQPRLQEASNTYGAKEGRFIRNMKKKIFHPMDRSKCTQVLESCRNDVTGALASLPDHWNHEAARGEEHPEAESTSQIKGSTPLVGDVLFAAPAVEEIDDPTPSIPPVVALQSPIPVTSPSPDEEQVLPDDQAKGTSNRRDWLSAVKTTFDVVEGVSGTIPVIGSYVGAAAKTMGSNQETADALESNARRLSALLEHFEQRSVDPRKDDLTTRIKDLQRELKSVQHKIEELNGSGVLRKAFSAKDRVGELKGYQETIRTALEQLQLLVALNTTTLIKELYNEGIREGRQRLLDRLGDAKYGAHGDDIKDVICLEGTRVQTLERINAWIRNTSTSENVLWIRGMAGRGKSTIASTVAYHWKYQAASAIFHFRRGQNKLDKRLVCALARQLGSNDLVPEVKDSILRSVQENPDIQDERLREQFQALFTRSLGRLQDTTLPILLIVDALDECESVDFAVKFVKLIEEFIPSLPVNVKFLLTTRPEAPLIRALEPREWHAEDLDSMGNMDGDIAQFLQRGFSRVREEYDLEEDWPPQDNIRAIVQMSQGLFQWAHTAIEYMMEGSPQDQLRELLQLPSICDGMDGLYLQILSKAFKKAKKYPARADLLLRMLGTLVVTPYPLSFEIFAFIYSDHAVFQNKTAEDITRYLRQNVLVDLGSLIHIPRSSTDPIQLVHTSVRDLLVDRDRCQGEPYAVDLARNHHDLAWKCLQLMERDLKSNICHLSDLSKPNSDPDVQELVRCYVPKGLQYCCRSWSINLIASRPEGTSGGWETISAADIKGFSEKKLLGWLEVMSLIGETRDSLKVAKEMYSWLQPIAFSALHIYASALPFCPWETTLWRCYNDFATTRVLNGRHRRAWSSSLWSKHIGSEAEAVAFSPDGEMIASGARDNTIQVWDAETGAPIGKPLRGHDNAVLSISFSPNSKLIASGSSDKTIRVWDAETGAPIGEPLRGHGDAVLSISFSPNGKLLVSGSLDNRIQLWDAESGTPLGKLLRGHDKAVQSISFSPNSKLFASGSLDKTIKLWDAETGAPVGEPLRGHDKAVQSISFSPNSKLLASGSSDKTIRVWDAETGAPIGKPLRGHDKAVWSISFSPNGKLLASGSSDKTIQLWDAETWAPIGEPLRGHDNRVVSISFSSSGKLLASGSWDKTIQLWDAEPGAQMGEPLRGHDDAVWSISFSPNSRLLASGSDDRTIRLWDAETGASIGEPLKGHDNAILSISFSPNSKLLASGSWDGTIQLWDAATGAAIGEPLRDHDSGVMSIAFSPNGKLLASGSWDKTIRLWDAETHAPIGEPLKGHDNGVQNISFSPNGKLLASASEDKTIRLWDAKTWAPMGEPLRGHEKAVQSISFSPNSKLLASGSSDKTIRVWDVKTGALTGNPLRGHDKAVWSISFSPNGKLIASGSSDKTIRLWDPETGAAIGEPLRGHDKAVWRISFSPNGKLLASGSSDKTIRLWDAETGAPIGEPLRGHDEHVQSISFSLNGKLLASGSEDQTVRLWDAETGAPIGHPLRGHDDAVLSISFSPNSKLLASGSSDDTVRLWDAETGAPVGEPLRGHDEAVLSISFSPNSKLLASGSSDNTIRLWDAETGAQVGEPLCGHGDAVLSISFSPNSKLIASGSSDQTIQLWDAEIGAPVGEPLRGYDNGVESISFSPDGKFIMSQSPDQIMHIWDVETGAKVTKLLGPSGDQLYFNSLSQYFKPFQHTKGFSKFLEAPIC
ncbi:hypothetical protein FRC04_005768 [Tulasnella sp. 424]|nr:hypothetical protein FRC04_005768 [Tulasnella sp. 424]